MKSVGEPLLARRPFRPCRARSLAILAFVCGALAATGQERAYKVIVNAKNPGAQIRRSDLATLFLNRAARWGHGPPAAPVDQSTQSPLREAFSTAVLGKPVLAIQNYWQQRILRDREIPPPVKGSDEEVIAYVGRAEGAVGYVSADAALPPTVKALKVLD